MPKRLKILLIEPDKTLASTYAHSLTAEGYDVAMSRGAQAAVAAADQDRPDVVITEIQLAGHSGIEFLYEFRSYDEWQSVPMIILSGIPESESGITPQMCEAAFVAAYLYKPDTTLARLQRAVKAALNSRIAFQ